MRLQHVWLLLVAGFFSPAVAVQVTIDPNNCRPDVQLTDWQVARFGPYNVCVNGTVFFKWTALHGLFQIPTIACPSNFTAPEGPGYKYLSPPAIASSFLWEVPNVTGHYWVTSQYQDDCRRGMIAEFYVTDPSSALRASAQLALAIAAIVGVALSVL